MAELCFQKSKTLPVSKSTSNNTAARAAFLTESLWPVGTTIKIYFIEPIDTSLSWKIPLIDDPNFLDPLYQTIQGKVDAKTLVERVLEERLSKIVNIKFETTTDVNQSDIRILFKQGVGCSSIVGNSRNLPKISRGAADNYAPAGKPEPTMMFSWLDISTVLHEFCHALGMIHEHQNPQNNPIRWNLDAVYCEFKKRNSKWTNEDIYKNVIEPYDTTKVNGSEYDKASIMIYSFPETTTCNRTELPLTLNSPPLAINPNYRLSNSDIDWLKIMYPQSGQRDAQYIRDTPKTVNPTATYEFSDVTQQIKTFVNDNWKYLSIGAGSLVGLWILSWLYSVFFGSSSAKKARKVLVK